MTGGSGKPVVRHGAYPRSNPYEKRHKKSSKLADQGYEEQSLAPREDGSFGHRGTGEGRAFGERQKKRTGICSPVRVV